MAPFTDTNLESFRKNLLSSSWWHKNRPHGEVVNYTGQGERSRDGSREKEGDTTLQHQKNLLPFYGQCLILVSRQPPHPLLLPIYIIVSLYRGLFIQLESTANPFSERRYISMRLHMITSRKPVIFRVTAVRNSYVANHLSLFFFLSHLLSHPY